MREGLAQARIRQQVQESSAPTVLHCLCDSNDVGRPTQHSCPARHEDACGATSSVHTLKPDSVLEPKVLLMATSVASRPRAMSTRPIRGTLFRGSNVCQ